MLGFQLRCECSNLASHRQRKFDRSGIWILKSVTTSGITRLANAGTLRRIGVAVPHINRCTIELRGIANRERHAATATR